jgi:hypothetical protein
MVGVEDLADHHLAGRRGSRRLTTPRGRLHNGRLCRPLPCPLPAPARRKSRIRPGGRELGGVERHLSMGELPHTAHSCSRATIRPTAHEAPTGPTNPDRPAGGLPRVGDGVRPLPPRPARLGTRPARPRRPARGLRKGPAPRRREVARLPRLPPARAGAAPGRSRAGNPDRTHRRLHPARRAPAFPTPSPPLVLSPRPSDPSRDSRLIRSASITPRAKSGESPRADPSRTGPVGVGDRCRAARASVRPDPRCPQREPLDRDVTVGTGRIAVWH